MFETLLALTFSASPFRAAEPGAPLGQSGMMGRLSAADATLANRHAAVSRGRRQGCFMGKDHRGPASDQADSEWVSRRNRRRRRKSREKVWPSLPSFPSRDNFLNYRS